MIEMSKNMIKVSDEAMNYFKSIQREYKKRTFTHLEYAVIVDDLIAKVEHLHEHPIVVERRKILRAKEETERIRKKSKMM